MWAGECSLDLGKLVIRKLADTLDTRLVTSGPTVQILVCLTKLVRDLVLNDDFATIDSSHIHALASPSVRGLWTPFDQLLCLVRYRELFG